MVATIIIRNIFCREEDPSKWGLSACGAYLQMEMMFISHRLKILYAVVFLITYLYLRILFPAFPIALVSATASRSLNIPICRNNLLYCMNPIKAVNQIPWPDCLLATSTSPRYTSILRCREMSWDVEEREGKAGEQRSSLRRLVGSEI